MLDVMSEGGRPGSRLAASACGRAWAGGALIRGVCLRRVFLGRGLCREVGPGGQAGHLEVGPRPDEVARPPEAALRVEVLHPTVSLDRQDRRVEVDELRAAHRGANARTGLRGPHEPAGPVQKDRGSAALDRFQQSVVGHGRACLRAEVHRCMMHADTRNAAGPPASSERP